MSNTFELEFIISEKDTISICNVVYNRMFFSKKELYFFVLGLLGGLSLWFYTRLLITLYLVGFFGLALIAISIYYYWIPVWSYQNHIKNLNKINLRISESGIEFYSDNVQSKSEWSFYKRAWETDQFYVLFYSDSFTLIPKRAFNSVEIEVTFRELLDSKIKEGLVKV